MSEKMTELRVYVVQDHGDLAFFYLVEDHPTNGEAMVATTNMPRNATALNFSASTADVQLIREDNERKGKVMMDLEIAGGAPVAMWPLFRNSDFRAAVLDRAYDFVSRNIVPVYEKATIEVEDDVLIVMGSGLAAAPSAARGGSGGSGAAAKGKGRPRSRRRQVHTWF